MPSFVLVEMLKLETTLNHLFGTLQVNTTFHTKMKLILQNEN
jgi:hypothetical protein